VSVTIVRNPDEGALRQAAALHCALLPGSAISRFGVNFANSFYRYAGRSPKEVVFAALDAGVVVAAAVVSLRPQGLQRRLLLHTPLLPHMVIHPLLAFGVVRERLTQRVEGDIDQASPEVVAIFTAAKHQGRGIGAQLLRTIENDLSARGLSRYGLRTEDVTGNRAVGFYDKQGFVVVGHVLTPHARFRVMTKHIGAMKV
jgi:ribosomal protein S18 acetylase RimI-like enzyme